jgi:acyl carrier protein
MDRRATLRGQRIDPGLVEDALAGHPGVRECAVVAHGADLVAYVAGNGDAPGRAAIRRFLTARLPAYLVPTRLVVLPALPRTPDGRRDLTALPEPPPAEAEPALRTDTERRLAAIWADLLGVDRVGARVSFFDAGGNSLDATRLVARIGAHLGVDLHIRHVFSNPTLEDLAARIEEERDDDRQLSDRTIR